MLKPGTYHKKAAVVLENEASVFSLFYRRRHEVCASPCFLPTLDKSIVEDCFRATIQKSGLPDSIFFDYTEKNTMPKSAGFACK